METCSICLNDLDEKGKGDLRVFKLPGCTHKFHKGCIYELMDSQMEVHKREYNRLKKISLIEAQEYGEKIKDIMGLCPLCRRQITTAHLEVLVQLDAAQSPGSPKRKSKKKRKSKRKTRRTKRK